jgi:hypothetical protein
MRNFQVTPPLWRIASAVGLIEDLPLPQSELTIVFGQFEEITIVQVGQFPRVGRRDEGAPFMLRREMDWFFPEAAPRQP